MASCPECGGRLIPLRPLLTLPWRNIKCRWCRAVLAMSPGARWIRDICLFFAGTGFTFWLLARFRQDPPVFVGVAFVLGWAALLFLGWLAEAVFPLRTIVPRDARWLRKSKPEVDPNSEK